jgi:GPH family glycoside/pentoside/hexuronide:cation symporter
LLALFENSKTKKMNTQKKLKIFEKIGYGCGDAGTNIAWRTMSTFLFIFYVDVFGLSPASAGLLLLIARLSDGVTDIFMGIIGDRTNTKRGQFRPWILWTAIPFGIILSLVFTTPPFGYLGKLIYAYVTYILFTLIYTANNVPYGALMGVMTSDDKERTSLSSFRFAGAYFGGILTQGLLIYLVLFFGNVNPSIAVDEIPNSDNYIVTVTSPRDIESAEVKCKQGFSAYIVPFSEWSENSPVESATALRKGIKSEPPKQASFEMISQKPYSFLVWDIEDLTADKIQCINQKKGYQHSVYLLSALLIIFLLITYFTTTERVVKKAAVNGKVRDDLKDLLTNIPWLIILVVGFIFCIYNGIKQGITVMYFKRYLNNESLSAIYMTLLLVMSGVAALFTLPMVKAIGKKNLFVVAILFSATANSLIAFAGPEDYMFLFVLGILSEFGAGIMPVLFFAMLGDCADYSEWKNGRRATGLIFSAGTFAFKFGGGIAGAILGWVLTSSGYNSAKIETITLAIPAIKSLMSWIPALIIMPAIIALIIYPLSKNKLSKITSELEKQRA